jgi:hypothetical protein
VIAVSVVNSAGAAVRDPVHLHPASAEPAAYAPPLCKARISPSIMVLTLRGVDPYQGGFDPKL